MSSHLVILGRVIPSPPSMDMKQCRYTNFYKSHLLILNFHEKVSGYVRQQFWSFSEISGGFCGISRNKVVTQNRSITDHKIFKYKPHPNITLVYTKNYSKHDMFLQNFHIFINKPAMLQQKFTVQVTTLPYCDDITRFDGIYSNKSFIVLQDLTSSQL